MSQDGGDRECHRMAVTGMSQDGGDGECHRMAVTGNVTGWQ